MSTSTGLKIMGKADIARTLARMAIEIVEINKGIEDMVFVGVPTRGVPLAKRLAALIKDSADVEIPVLAIDPHPYWDNRQDRPVQPPPLLGEAVDVTGQNVFIVDDVLATARTTRATMEAISHMGTPRTIRLVVLIRREKQELPIRADVCGKGPDTIGDRRVNVQLTETDGGEDAVFLLDSES